MRSGRGKSKGSAFERKIAKTLSLWLTNGADDKQLIRSVLSGGWGGARVADGWRQVGDLAPNGPAGENFRRYYAVECKHHRNIDLYGLWTREKGTIIAWWTKLLAETKAVGGRPIYPILIFCSNNMPTMVGMLPETVPHYQPQGESGWSKCATFPWLSVTIFPFKDLLTISPENLISAASHTKKA